jgi:hypothetical protein
MYTATTFPAEEIYKDLRLQKTLLKFAISPRLMGTNFNTTQATKMFARLVTPTSDTHGNKSSDNVPNRFDTWVVSYDEYNEVAGFLVAGGWGLPKNAMPMYTIQSVSFPNAQGRLDWSKPHPFATATNELGRHLISRRIYDLIWMQPDRPAIRKYWKSGNDMLRYCPEFYDEETNSYKWHRYMEGIVKKGETHPNPAYQKMILSSRPAPTDIIVRRFVFRNEYRPEWPEIKSFWSNYND